MKVTLSLQDEIEESQEKIQTLLEKQDELANEAKDYERGTDEFEAIEGVYNYLENQRRTLEGRVKKFSKYLEEWGGDGTFVVNSDLNFADLMVTKDDVDKASYEVDGKGEVRGYPREGYHRLCVLERAVIDSPEPINKIGEVPGPVGNWLYETIDALNTVDEPLMGNRYLRERLLLSE